MIMDYNELVEQAIKKNEVVKLLVGENGYRVEVSQFTSEVFPTDINMVLVNCFYKQKDHINNIDSIFYKAFMDLLRGSAADVYIAVLYFDACIFHEERDKATFQIEKDVLAENLKKAIKKNKKMLQGEIIFSNDIKKRDAYKIIKNFNKYYVEKYGFSLMD